MRMLSELKVYASLWNKYRPVILKLMSDAENGPQQYKLFAHEFRALNQREKSGFTFSLEVAGGRAINNIKTSLVAQDLLQVLQQSKRANELMNESSYALNMDRNFVLHVNKKEKLVEAAPAV
jgi:hypothetical protein